MRASRRSSPHLPILFRPMCRRKVWRLLCLPPRGALSFDPERVAAAEKSPPPDQQKAQKEAEAATAKATIAKLEATIPLLLQKANVQRPAARHQARLSRNRGKLVKEEHEFEVQRHHLQEAEAAIAAITETRNHTASDSSGSFDADLPDAERKAAGLREDRSPCRFRS